MLGWWHRKKMIFEIQELLMLLLDAVWRFDYELHLEDDYLQVL